MSSASVRSICAFAGSSSGEIPSSLTRLVRWASNSQTEDIAGAASVGLMGAFLDTNPSGSDIVIQPRPASHNATLRT